MNRSERVAVIISAHRLYSTLELCVHGFYSIMNEPGDLIFVDNGSAENLGDKISARFPGATVIRLENNRLFCGGYNAGIREAMDRGYDFVLLANADTEVLNRDFIEELLRSAQRWPQAAFIGPKVYFRSPEVVQNTCLRYPTVLRSALVWLPWRLFPSYFSRQPKHEKEVEFLNSVCVLCRIRALHEIGLLDENIGGYMEDGDWSWRAKEKGWQSVFSPVPSIIHHEEYYGYEHSSLKSFLLKRNTVYWFVKTGKQLSARIYAILSLLLARLRSLFADTESRKEHAYFIKRLTRAYEGILRAEILGAWFGPPYDLWQDIEKDKE